MSKKFGFLVVSRRTGYMLEGKDHAAKLFETLVIAKQAGRPLSDQAPVQISYDTLAASLLKGSAFCFDTDELHAKFIKCLRNDQGNKVFLPYSQNRLFVRWRASTQLVSVSDKNKIEFNPDVLVKKDVAAAA
jgi:hypothetical protein